jgi:hypothetical protein
LPGNLKWVNRLFFGAYNRQELGKSWVEMLRKKTRALRREKGDKHPDDSL